MIGQTISHYKITAKLGEGGMGVVYKAEDTRLRRVVALKFLHTQALGDEEQKARFLREAQSVALLDHTNIAAVHDIGEQDGHTFMAIAFVDGPELAAKIKERPLKLDEALDITIQICEGLKEAHEKGVTHRDIKPSNIMLTKKGRVKITDFGLAHLAGRSKLTKSGTSLGTPAYMSPEQALGDPTDRRSDIWGVGVVLYEMIAGKIPFAHEHQQAIVYSIINEKQEPLTALRTGLPTELDRVLGKALAKKPEERYQHVDDLLVDLRRLRKSTAAEAKSTMVHPEPITAPATPTTPVVTPQPVVEQQTDGTSSGPRTPIPYAVPAWKTWLPWALFAASTIAFLTVAMGPSSDRSTEQRPLRRFSIRPLDPVDTEYRTQAHRSVGISPSGRHVAFIGSEGQLWVRDLEQNEPRIIQGVKQVRVLSWSPDSEFILFSSRVNTEELLQKVPVQGGPATAICEVGYLTDIAVSDDASTVVYSSGSVSELWEVAFSGGTPKPVLSEIEKEEIFAEHFGGSQTSLGMFPLFLPSEAGERVLIFGIGFPDTPTQRMMVLDMDTRRREILPPGVAPVYSPTGHLMYGLGRDPRNLWALPFSLSGLRAEGEPFLIAQDGWQHSLSEDGTLVYLESEANPSQLVWRDRGGKEMGSIGAGDWPAISPDGSRVAFNRDDGDIWVHDLTQANSRKVTADQAGDISPVWSRDGKRLLFSSARAGSWDIWMTDLERVGGESVRVTSSAELEVPVDWSPNAKFVTYHTILQGERPSLWFLEHDEQTGEWKPQEFLRTGRGDLRPRLSPDGRFVAYFSYVSGQAEVYVERFPEGGGQKLASTNEGRSPRWRADGKELFYMGGGPVTGAKAGLFSVPVSTTPDFSVAGRPIRLFDVATSQLAYDVSADGQRFLFSEQPEETPEVEIRVVQNWYEEFRGRE